MTESTTEVLHGAVAVIVDEGCFLCIRRAAEVKAPGRWCFPGGRIEPGESEAEALVREVREEVGLDVEPARKLWEWTRPDGRLVLHWWQAARVDQAQALRLNPQEADQAIWATVAELRDLDGLLESAVEFLDFLEATNPPLDEAVPGRDSVEGDAGSTGSMTRRTFVAGGCAAAAGVVLGGATTEAASERPAARPRRLEAMAIESTMGVIQPRPAGLKLADWADEDAKRYADAGARLDIRYERFDRSFFEHVETRYVDYVCGLLRQAGERKIDLVLLPEAMLVVSRNVSRTRRGKFIELCRWSNKTYFDAIRPIAKKHSMIVASCLYQVDDRGRMTNDGVLTDADGETIGLYHKVHLPGWHDEDGTEVTNFVAGDDYPVFETRVGKLGFLICYDVDFPEAASCLALQGADAILHPTVGYNFPDEEEQVAEARLRTRATDNHIYVACAMPGAGPVREGGCSAIVDPCGSVIATAGKRREAVIQASVTLGAPRVRYWGKRRSDARETLRRKRRPDTYGVLVEKRPPGFPAGKHAWGRDYLYEPQVGLP